MFQIKLKPIFWTEGLAHHKLGVNEPIMILECLVDLRKLALDIFWVIPPGGAPPCFSLPPLGISPGVSPRVSPWVSACKKRRFHSHHTDPEGLLEGGF